MVSIMESLTELFHFILENGNELKNGKCCLSNPLVNVISKDFPMKLDLILKDYYDSYAIKASAGHGSWGKVMFVAVLDKILNRIFNGYSASNGVYPAYLVTSNCQEIYLVYMLGVGTKNDRQLTNEVKAISPFLTPGSFLVKQGSLDLGDTKARYSDAILLYKKYDLTSDLSEERLVADLKEMMALHYNQGIPAYLSYKNFSRS